MPSNYDLIYTIDTIIPGVRFEKIEGYSVIGDYRSGANLHPIQYKATSTTRPGDDEPFEGIGWNVHSALKNLLNNMIGAK